MDQGGDRRGTFHGVREPDVKWNLGGLAAGADEQEQSGRGDDGIADGKVSAARQVRNFGEAQRAKVPGDGEHAQQEAGVADAVDDECLIGGGAGRLTMEIESDQQIRTQAHALPSHKHEGIVVPQDEREHGEHEEIQVAEEAVVAALVRHVAGGINVDQRRRRR